MDVYETHVTGAEPRLLDPERLQLLARQRQHDYAAAKPFPHIVIDDLFPKEGLDRVLSEVPSPGEVGWIKFDDARGKKLASEVEGQFGHATREMLHQLNSSAFIDFLETLTGISGLIPDPHFWGGGVHQIVRGGFLKIHTDFNHHPRLKLDRRLNLLIYLNPDWQEEWGGALELWDADMAACGQRILPIFGRCVIFSTDDFSNHGHPDPLTCPETISRKSLALYYYSSGRPRSETAGKHYSTAFRRRPGERLILTPATIAQNLLPPIVMSMISALRHRRQQ